MDVSPALVIIASKAQKHGGSSKTRASRTNQRPSSTTKTITYAITLTMPTP